MINKQLKDVVTQLRQDVTVLEDAINTVNSKIGQAYRSQDTAQADLLQIHVVRDALDSVMRLKRDLYNVWQTL
jgi:hypothetical protein